MGLFRKKEINAVAFVGRYGKWSAKEVDAYSAPGLYSMNVMNSAEKAYPDAENYKIMYFYDWWSKTENPSLSTIESIRDSGFNAFMGGEEGKVFEAINRALVRNKLGEINNYHPHVITGSWTGRQSSSGWYAIICEVFVKVKK